ncbi:hypothetical protein J0H58_14790 [bacterium]|nr:hypothetical protein [bacterium]
MDSGSDRLLSERRDYLLRFLPTHLAGKGQAAQLERLLTTFDFLQAKLDHSGPQSLLGDFEIARSCGLAERRSGLRHLGESIRLARHILDQDSKQLRSQLWGRLHSSPAVDTASSSAWPMDR